MTNGEFKIELEKRTVDFSVAVLRLLRKIPLYNLDMIIAVGYRVNSLQATRFRRWATKVLRD